MSPLLSLAAIKWMPSRLHQCYELVLLYTVKPWYTGVEILDQPQCVTIPEEITIKNR